MPFIARFKPLYAGDPAKAQLDASWQEVLAPDIAGSISVAEIGADSASVNQLYPGWRIYYVVLPNGAAAPTREQIVAGHNAADAPALAAGNKRWGAFAGLFVFDDDATGLSEGVAYDIYSVGSNGTRYSNISFASVTNEGVSDIEGYIESAEAAEDGAAVEGEFGYFLPQLTFSTYKPGTYTGTGWTPRVTAT